MLKDEADWKSWPSQILPSGWLVTIASSPALITPLPANMFPNKIALKVLNNVTRNPRFCSFASSLIISLIPFLNKQDSLET